jgi:hypothetical protein
LIQCAPTRNHFHPSRTHLKTGHLARRTHLKISFYRPHLPLNRLLATPHSPDSRIDPFQCRISPANCRTSNLPHLTLKEAKIGTHSHVNVPHSPEKDRLLPTALTLKLSLPHLTLKHAPEVRKIAASPHLTLSLHQRQDVPWPHLTCKVHWNPIAQRFAAVPPASHLKLCTITQQRTPQNNLPHLTLKMCTIAQPFVRTGSTSRISPVKCIGIQSAASHLKPAPRTTPTAQKWYSTPHLTCKRSQPHNLLLPLAASRPRVASE